MPTDDTVARLKALSERLDRLRKEAQDIHNLASTEARTARTSERQTKMPNRTDRRATRSS